MRARTALLGIIVPSLFSLAVGCSRTEAPSKEASPAPPAAPSPAPGEGGAVAEGKVLFGQKCGACHDLALAASRAETKERWTSLVKEMQGKKAGWISDAEAGKIVEYLAAEHGRT